MSELPKGWLGLTLSEVVDIQKGKKPFDLGEKNSTRQIPYINIAAFETGYIREYAVEQNIPKCEPKDTLLVWDGARAGLSGRGANGYIGSTLAKISSLYTNPDYLFYFFQSIYKILNTQTKGVGIPHIDPNVLKNLKFPLPPLNEQTRIVAKLEELFSDLDAGVSELKTAQAKLKQYRQSLLKAAVEGELSRVWRESRSAYDTDETGVQLLERILIERRQRWEEKQLAKFAEQGKQPPKDWQKKYPEPVQPDTTDLPKLPDGWVWSSIGQCFHVAVGATPSRKEPSYWNGNIPWVSSGEVRFNRISKTKESITDQGIMNSSTQINPIGSVMLGMIGEGKTRGQVAILEIEAANNQNCAAIWVPETDIPSEYIYYWLWSRYEETRQGSSGNNQPALNKRIIENIPLPLPPLSELNLIIIKIDKLLEAALLQESEIAFSLAQAAAQRKNILRTAFAGKLVPQDPNDEPANELLARIQAERAAQPKKIKGRQAKADLLLSASMDFAAQATFNLEYDIQYTLRKDRMTGLESLKKRIIELENCRFSAQELLAESGLNYDQFTEFLIQLLSEQVPLIRQFFDKENQKMILERVSA